jgi:hypothetical protein
MDLIENLADDMEARDMARPGVEPLGGWPKVGHKFYVMQGDIYLKGDTAVKRLHEAAVDKMEKPDFVVFNGSAGSLAKERALKAKVGETVRILFGNDHEAIKAVLREGRNWGNKMRR